MQEIRKGPYLAAALICEKVLEEKDGVKSAIRIFDQLKVSVGCDPEEVESFPTDFYMLFSFRVDDQEQKVHQLKVDLSDGQDRVKSTFNLEVPFETDSNLSLDVVINSTITFTQAGRYWFDVYLNDVWMTRIPLQIDLFGQTNPGIN